jgi:hypothetical protein
MQLSLQASLLNVGNLDRSIEFKAKTGPTSTRWSTRSASDQETDNAVRAPFARLAASRESPVEVLCVGRGWQRTPAVNAVRRVPSP